MDTSTQHLSDYLAILKRRRKQVLHMAAGVFVASATLAFTIPSVYRSTATILIEQQEVPHDLVPSTVTGFANQRLQVIQTRVLTPENLLKTAEKHKIVSQKADTVASQQELVARMRRSIKVEPVSANVTDPQRGTSMMATIAFTVSFDAETPKAAQDVANELAGLFLNENLRIRTQKAERASGFLAEEEDKLRQHLADLEARLAAYKERNAGRLPELMNLNMAMLERTQKELEDAERQIYSLEERKLLLQGQLTSVEPYSGQSPGGRLKELQTQYLSAAALYAPDHPDVVRLRREVESLKKEYGAMDERDALETQIRKARGELAAARQKYAADHPDVVRLSGALAALEAKAAAAPSAPSGLVLKPDNPAYIALQTQLDTVNLSLKAAREQRARAKEKMGDYERRLVQTPRVEQEGLALQREYDSAVKKYRELKQSLMGAELAVELEREQKGERFSILEPPQLPDSPRMPNRRAFLMLGIVLGFGSGIGYASIAEYMDRTIRGSKAVAAVLKAPPLAVIPYIPNGTTSASIASRTT